MSISSIIKIFDNLSQPSKIILVSALGIAIASIPTTIALIAINSTSISYKNQHTEIQFAGKARQQINHAEYSNKKFRERLLKLEAQIESLTPETIDDVRASFHEFEPTATEAIEQSEELSDYVESAIAPSTVAPLGQSPRPRCLAK